LQLQINSQEDSAGAGDTQNIEQRKKNIGGMKYDEVASELSRYASGVQYWKVEESPDLEEGELSDVPPLGSPAARGQHQRTEDTLPAVKPEADSQCGQPDDSRPAARHNARTLPPRNSFPGLRLRPGCNASRKFLSQGMGHPAVHQGLSNGWIEDDDY